MKKQTYTKPEIKVYSLDIEELMDNLQNASKESLKGDEEDPNAYAKPSSRGFEEDLWEL